MCKFNYEISAENLTTCKLLTFENKANALLETLGNCHIFQVKIKVYLVQKKSNYQKQALQNFET